MTNVNALIPTFLSIDVEPDGFQFASGETPGWRGFDAAYVFMESLREILMRSTGAVPHFGWYLRMDPQIEQVYGRPDAAARAFPRRLSVLRSCGDSFGVHMHPLRRSQEHARWVHDFRDRAWLRECTHASLDAFERWEGRPARLFRSGAGFLNEDIVDVLDERGVEYELSLEPVTHWKQRAEEVGTGIDSAPTIGDFIDCEHVPMTPYRPARGNFQRRGGRDARSIHLVPMTAGPYALARPGWWSATKRVVRRYYKPLNRHLYSPLDPWPSPRYFWDLIAHRLAGMKRPYLSLAIRTGAADSPPSQRYRAMLAALAGHPLRDSLRFVEPGSGLQSVHGAHPGEEQKAFAPASLHSGRAATRVPAARRERLDARG